MTSSLGLVAKAALASALSLAGAAAMAQTNFSLNLGSTCNNTGTTSTWGATNTGTCGSVNSVATSVTAWAADTTANATASFVKHWTTNYGASNGLGVTLTTGTGAPESLSAPEHTIDNNKQLEGVLLYFGQAITLTQLTVGWGQNDTDLSLFAYTGSATTSANTAMSGTKVGGATGTSGIGSSWSLIGNYADANNPNGTNTTDTSFGVNASSVSSSWWFVSAYNSKFGGTCTDVSGPGDTNSGCSNTSNTTTGGTDFFKLLAVAGTYGGGGSSSQTPEPASIALVSMGLIGALGMRRRRAVKPA